MTDHEAFGQAVQDAYYGYDDTDEIAKAIKTMATSASYWRGRCAYYEATCVEQTKMIRLLRGLAAISDDTETGVSVDMERRFVDLKNDLREIIASEVQSAFADRDQEDTEDTDED